MLGVPGNQVIFTSFSDDTVGGQTEFPDTAPSRGDWGGLVFRNDSDLEPLGVFLNYVNESYMRYGGGQVTVNGVQSTFNTIDLQTARPTVSNNVIIDSAGPDLGDAEQLRGHAVRTQREDYRGRRRLDR